MNSGATALRGSQSLRETYSQMPGVQVILLLFSSIAYLSLFPVLLSVYLALSWAGSHTRFHLTSLFLQVATGWIRRTKMVHVSWSVLSKSLLFIEYARSSIRRQDKNK